MVSLAKGSGLVVPAAGDPRGAWKIGGRLDTFELVEDALELAGERLAILRPSDLASLLDGEGFAEDEFLPYWAELWPSARSLAEALPGSLEGRRVLELGCGLGVPSLVAARRGAAVLATDWAQDALDLLALNAGRNGVLLEAARVDWRSAQVLLGGPPFDLVVGADLLYEARNVAPLADLVARLGAEMLLADPGRQPAGEFLQAVAGVFEVGEHRAGVHRLLPRPGGSLRPAPPAPPARRRSPAGGADSRQAGGGGPAGSGEGAQR